MRIQILMLGLKGLISFSWQNVPDLFNSEHNFDVNFKLADPDPAIPKRTQKGPAVDHARQRERNKWSSHNSCLAHDPSPPPKKKKNKKTILLSLMEKGFSSTFKRINVLFTFLTKYCLCKQRPKIASFLILSAMLLQSGIDC